jgi:hypothetical protein
MEWLDKIIWTQLVKSVAYFTIGMITAGIAGYKAGFWQGYQAGLAHGLNLWQGSEEIVRALTEEVMKLTEEVRQLSLLVRNLSSPRYYQP